MFRVLLKWTRAILIVVAVILCYLGVVRYLRENAILREMIRRLEADSRVAQVLVTEVRYDEQNQKTYTTIKFLEYDSKGQPLNPEYFTFSGNIIQFQSLVIRFDDLKIRAADKLKGKSAYLFLKVFMLDGPETQVFEITKANEVPAGYQTGKILSPFEEKLWHKFWVCD